MKEGSVQIIILIGTILIVGLMLYLIFKSPFQYPYFKYFFDISGKKKSDIENLIDVFLNEKKFFMIKNHKEKIEQWKIECQKKIEKSILKKYRTKQYQKSLDDRGAYIFYITRRQTRYKQINYIKTSYKVVHIVGLYSCDYNFLFKRNELLESINYECTLKEYNTKNQRKLMTKALRKQIITRDNYTCQNCGKYMPDEVGLHIDHIVSISKGGKTIPSNLQVLCSKCNGSKYNK